ncbi:uncharacterized protein METZ01_LOCUS308320 [marine metagenome]|uniref:Phospholipid/glycerol acyltransferase domain-containing protein n=1 Tax=marine metagenome TaxID=408172 RepID=A0A382N323_9ZZZZ
MAFIKAIVLAVAVVIVTLVFGVTAIILSPFNPSGNLVHLFARWWSRTLLWLGRIPVTILGLENVPLDRACILASNHASAADIPILFGRLPIQFRVIAKDALFRLPILGLCMRLAGYISIDRGSPAKAMRSLQRAVQKLQAGLPVLVFPEGTRSRSGELQPFHKGAFLLAIQAGVPVVPIGINGSFDILTSGSLRIRPGVEVAIVIGPPVETDTFSKKDREQLSETVHAAVAGCLHGEMP